ncbi:MAG: HAD family hydrolase [Thermoplasmata archaeon]
MRVVDPIDDLQSFRLARGSTATESSAGHGFRFEFPWAIEMNVRSPRNGSIRGFAGGSASSASHSRGSLMGRRISVFATDLDRTLIRPGRPPTATGRTALREARAMGLRTLLVSGRQYGELQGFARAFGEVDGIVAENGAMVEVPLGTKPTVVGLRPAASLRRRLEERGGVNARYGQVVISVPREERRKLMAALRGLPVRVIANVDRLMVLPVGVDKWSGTRLALRRLGLARSGYAGIGDAETDLDLMRGATLSGAVGNALRDVRAAADYRCRGEFDRGVLEFVRGPLAERVRGTADRGSLSDEPRALGRAARSGACSPPR